MTTAFDFVPHTPVHMLGELYREFSIKQPVSPVILATVAAARRGWDVLSARWDERSEQWRFTLTCRSGERVTVCVGIANPTTDIIDVLPKR